MSSPSSSPIASPHTSDTLLTKRRRTRRRNSGLIALSCPGVHVLAATGHAWRSVSDSARLRVSQASGSHVGAQSGERPFKGRWMCPW
eukprot:6184599-Pleurochrysis_carterae.AAC.2